MKETTVQLLGVEITLWGHLDDGYFTAIDSHFGRETFLAEILRSQLDPGAVIMDVGANIGATAVLAARSVENAKIVAIEPSPRAFACLEKTLAANGVAPMGLLQVCVGAADGWADFHEAADLSASHIGQLLNGGAPTRSSTRVRAVDSIVEEMALDRLDFIKIDVEGFEREVLAGMQRTLARFQPLVFMEFNSFTTAVYGRLSPRVLLDAVYELAESILYKDVRGQPVRATTDSDQLAFLHSNMVDKYCVDDIAFTASAERLARLEAWRAAFPPPFLPPPPPRPHVLRRLVRALRG